MTVLTCFDEPKWCFILIGEIKSFLSVSRTWLGFGWRPAVTDGPDKMLSAGDGDRDCTMNGDILLQLFEDDEFGRLRVCLLSIKCGFEDKFVKIGSIFYFIHNLQLFIFKLQEKQFFSFK